MDFGVPVVRSPHERWEMGEERQESETERGRRRKRKREWRERRENTWMEDYDARRVPMPRILGQCRRDNDIFEFSAGGGWSRGITVAWG